MGVVRMYRCGRVLLLGGVYVDILIIIITFNYSTCNSSFLAAVYIRIYI